MTKYKELPAFETNEFNVDDIINVYNVNRQIKSIIRVINGYHIIVDSTNGEDIRQQVHFKQCRKLEEIEPLEWIVTQVYTQHGLGIASEGINERLDSYSSKKIKVREVIE